MHKTGLNIAQNNTPIQQNVRQFSQSWFYLSLKMSAYISVVVSAFILVLTVYCELL